MKNYERYNNYTPGSPDKQRIMRYLCRIPSDRKILPQLWRIKGKSILDVGLGTGDYTRLLLKYNRVVGVDRNPHFCLLPIKVYHGDATQLRELVGQEKFDVVFSTWMTEYLNPQQLSAFFRQAKISLKENGELVTTIISKYGLGFLYITVARFLRGVGKYNYSKREVCDILREAGFKEILIMDLNSWMGIPWAYLVTAK